MRGYSIRIVTLLLTFAISAAGVPAAAFPDIVAETLGGQKVEIPAGLAGKPALLVIGFTQQSKQQTSFWRKRIPKDLVPLYSVTVLQGVPSLVRRLAVHSMKSDVPKDNYDHVLLVYEKEEQLKEAAGFEEPDAAYLVLLAPDGSVRWMFHGPFSRTKLKELSDHVKGMRQ